MFVDFLYNFIIFLCTRIEHLFLMSDRNNKRSIPETPDTPVKASDPRPKRARRMSRVARRLDFDDETVLIGDRWGNGITIPRNRPMDEALKSARERLDAYKELVHDLHEELGETKAKMRRIAERMKNAQIFAMEGVLAATKNGETYARWRNTHDHRKCCNCDSSMPRWKLNCGCNDNSVCQFCVVPLLTVSPSFPTCPNCRERIDTVHRYI